jgi:hypothetical protein
LGWFEELAAYDWLSFDYLLQGQVTVCLYIKSVCSSLCMEAALGQTIQFHNIFSILLKAQNWKL